MHDARAGPPVSVLASPPSTCSGVQTSPSARPENRLAGILPQLAASGRIKKMFCSVALRVQTYVAIAKGFRYISIVEGSLVPRPFWLRKSLDIQN